VTIETRIQTELDRIEAEEQVSILYACEPGSRAWDFESKDSDYDVRFFYLRQLRRREIPPHWIDFYGHSQGRKWREYRVVN